MPYLSDIGFIYNSTYFKIKTGKIHEPFPESKFILKSEVG